MNQTLSSLNIISNSIKGENRDVNQDSAFFVETPEYCLLFLFDGVSSIGTSIDFIEACKVYIEGHYKEYFKVGKIRLAELLYSANKYATEQRTYGRSTCSAVYINKKSWRAVCVNIGDSRIYEYTNQSLEAITVDDRLPGSRNILTKSLGVNLQKSEIEQKQILFNAGLLLCSDGFYELMERQKSRYFSILQFKKAKSIEKAIENNQLGLNQDDSTYILIRKNGISNRE